MRFLLSMNEVTRKILMPVSICLFGHENDVMETEKDILTIFILSLFDYLCFFFRKFFSL